MRDITGEEAKYTLDSHGFQLAHHESKTKEFDDLKKLKSDYFPEVQELVKNLYVALPLLIWYLTQTCLAPERSVWLSSTTPSAMDRPTGTSWARITPLNAGLFTGSTSINRRTVL